jgi:hypothetical protein
VPVPGPDKALCGAQRPNQPEGVTCKRVAGHGTPHLGSGRCARHGGNSRNHVKAASTELARQACATLGVPIDTHPAEALLREVCETAGNVEFYRSLVMELPTHPDPDVFIPGEGDDDEGHWERGAAGVYGRTYHVSGVPTGEAKPHVLVALYNDERKHLLAVTTAALKAGVEARRVQLAEQEASLIAEGFRAFAVACGLDPAAPKVREAFRAQLTLISGGRSAGA